MSVKFFLLLSPVFFFATLLSGQNIPVDTNATFVIANGGLNLRSKPGVDSKKIANIPFGSSVRYLSEKSFKTDSLYVRHSHNKEKELIEGNWVQVEYQNIRGYVLDFYLGYPPDNKNFFSENFTEEFVLLFPGCGCAFNNLHDPSGWKWFGYFEDSHGNYTIEEINISYYRSRTITCELIISASKNDRLSFIIGNKKGRLSRNAVVQGKSIRLYHYNQANPINQSDLERASVELIELDGLKEWKPGELYLKRDNKKQLLNKPEYDYPNEITFMGDLDGDEKDDYIIHFGDKGRVVLLYLTSKAKPGKLIEKVAMFFAPFCC